MASVIGARAGLPASNDPEFGAWLPIVFDILQAIGLVGNVVLILTFLLAKDVRRHVTWLGFCCAWVFSSTAYLILAVAGRQTGPIPPYGLCVTQAALIYGAPVLTVYSMLSCVIQLWSVVFHVMNKAEPRARNILRYCLLIVPYALSLVVIVAALVLGLQQKQDVMRAGSGIYCVINNGIPGKINAILVVAGTITMLGFEAAIGVYFYRHVKGLRERDRLHELPVAMLVRVVIFTFIGILGIGISLVFVTKVFTPLPNIFIAALPGAAFIIFGTQKDILNFWLRRGPPPASNTYQETTSTGSSKA